MVKRIGLAVVVLLMVAAGFVAMRASDYKVTRTKAIAAPPAAVHALINDFHRWDDWSPWAKLDPNMKVEHSGPAAGVGASYHWTSDNSDVGEGRMTITESVPAERVAIKLEFVKPFAAISPTVFTVKPAAGGSTVEWTMTGEQNFIAKAFMLAMGGMDKAVGPDFEKGLTQMKARAERP